MSGRVLTVVPDSERVEAWLTARSRQEAFVDARAVCTLAQLVERCEPARWAGLAPAPPLLSLLAVAALAPEHLAPTFGAAAREPDFAAQTLELLAHLRAQGASPRQLRQAALEVEAPLAARTTALAALWEGLDAALARRGLVDPGELTALAARRLRAEGLPPSLRGWRGLRVQGVTDLFPARLDFLEALAGACHAAGAALEVRWPSSGEPAADLFVLDAVRQMEARWQALDVEVAPEEPAGPLGWAGAAAFAEAPEAAPAPGLEGFTAATPREEARQVAARVKGLVSAGLPPERIAVALRDLAGDTEAFLEALGDLGVPVRARLGVPLLATPPGRLALAVLDLAEEEVPAEALASVLESGLVDCLAPGAASPRGAFLAAGVRSERWGASPERGAYSVRLQALAGRTRAASARAGLESLGASVEQVLRALRGLTPEAPALEQLEAWWEVLSRLGLFRRLATRPEPALDPALGWGDALDRARARDQAAGEALLELLGGLKEALVATGLARRTMTRAAFARLVRVAGAQVNLLAKGPRAGAVWLLDARELPGREFDALFLGGLVDGRFPGRAAPLPLLAEEERLALNQASRAQLFRLGVVDGGARLPARVAEDRLLFALALGAAPAVTLSRARADAAGRELLPSPFLDGLERAVSGFRLAPLAREPVPRLAEVWSESDLRARLALEALCPPATRQARGEGLADAALSELGDAPWLRHARELAAAEVERLRYFSDPAQPAGPHSGQLPAALLGALAPRLAFDARRPASASVLRDYGGCAFLGLGKHLLGLESLRAAGEEADERTQGSFLHEVLAEVVPELHRRGWLGAAPAHEAEVQRLVEEVVTAVAARVESSEATGHPALWSLGQDRLVREVVRVVGDASLARPFPGLEVEGVELAFGDGQSQLPALASVTLPAALPGEVEVALKGSIDRLDAAPGRVGVLDYKRGKGGGSKARAALLVSDFQLPLYLHAVRSAFPGAGLEAAWVLVGGREVRTLAALLEQHATTLEELLATDAPTRQALAGRPQANLANAVHGLLGRLRGGDFGPRPLDCGFCEWKRVCRLTTRRLTEGS
jgi:hypothetical protein